MLREKTGATPGISQKTENTEFRGKGRKPPTGSLPYPEKETETQKTNSIPFAKPIRRPMNICAHLTCEVCNDTWFRDMTDRELADYMAEHPEANFRRVTDPNDGTYVD